MMIGERNLPKTAFEVTMNGGFFAFIFLIRSIKLQTINSFSAVSSEALCRKCVTMPFTSVFDMSIEHTRLAFCTLCILSFKVTWWYSFHIFSLLQYTIVIAISKPLLHASLYPQPHRHSMLLLLPLFLVYLVCHDVFIHTLYAIPNPYRERSAYYYLTYAYYIYVIRMCVIKNRFFFSRLDRDRYETTRCLNQLRSHLCKTNEILSIAIQKVKMRVFDGIDHAASGIAITAL